MSSLSLPFSEFNFERIARLTLDTLRSEPEWFVDSLDVDILVALEAKVGLCK
jgi:hypothetical protein